MDRKVSGKVITLGEEKRKRSGALRPVPYRGSWLPRDGVVYVEEVGRLRQLHPELAHWTDQEIEQGWSAFCEHYLSIGWESPARSEIFLAWIHLTNSGATISRDASGDDLLDAVAATKPWERKG